MPPSGSAALTTSRSARAPCGTGSLTPVSVQLSPSCAAVTFSADAVQPRPGSIVLEEIREGLALIDEVEDWPRTGVLLDVRAPDRYRGDAEPLDPIAGHIPGALNAPMAELQDDGRFRSPSELRAYFTGLGVDGSTRVGTSCGSGVTAAHTALALHLAGFEAAPYIGSWSHWVTDPRRPVATGSGSEGD